MRRVDYRKITYSKLWGEMRTFDIDNLPKDVIATNDVDKYLYKNEIYAIADYQPFKQTVKDAPRYIVIKEDD